MTETLLVKAIIESAPQYVLVIIAAVFAWLFFRDVGKKVIEVQTRQAEAMGSQAQALNNLTATISRAYERDDNEHREIIILLKVLTEKTQRIEESLNGTK